MAITDFFGRDIGGYNRPAGNQFPTDSGIDIYGGATSNYIEPKGTTGITWGDVLANFSNNRTGMSQSASIGSLTPAQFPGSVKNPQTVPIMNISSQLPMQEEKQQGQSDWQSILKIIMAMYGGGTGGASFTGSGVGTPVT